MKKSLINFKIDALINNAGAIFMDKTFTDEGLEKTFALNHMSYFVLSNLFLETFKSLKVINVSSEAHRGISLRLDDLQYKKRYYGWLSGNGLLTLAFELLSKKYDSKVCHEISKVSGAYGLAGGQSIDIAFESKK